MPLGFQPRTLGFAKTSAPKVTTLPLSYLPLTLTDSFFLSSLLSFGVFSFINPICNFFFHFAFIHSFILYLSFFIFSFSLFIFLAFRILNEFCMPFKRIKWFQAAGIVCAFVGIVLLSGLVVYCKRGRPSSADLKSSIKNFKTNSRFQVLATAAKDFVVRNFGFRFLIVKNDQWKYIREDMLQNLMVLINGILAILFAFRCCNLKLL